LLLRLEVGIQLFLHHAKSITATLNHADELVVGIDGDKAGVAVAVVHGEDATELQVALAGLRDEAGVEGDEQVKGSVWLGDVGLVARAMEDHLGLLAVDLVTGHEGNDIVHLGEEPLGVAVVVHVHDGGEHEGRGHLDEAAGVEDSVWLAPGCERIEEATPRLFACVVLLVELLDRQSRHRNRVLLFQRLSVVGFCCKPNLRAAELCKPTGRALSPLSASESTIGAEKGAERIEE